ncbi:MAG: DUF2341 domain-containing protein [Bacteroidales bacterium]|nr:DUF2341 domain-containing protein [Bacteroidales bacterium]
MKTSMSYSRITLMVLIIIATELLTSQKMSAQELYDLGWMYRLPVTVSNTTGGTLTDYQFRVTLDDSFAWNHCNSSGSDIRFTLSDGQTELPYWFENWTYETSSTIWVKITSLPAGVTGIYMYYGNSSAITSTASGEATFLFFDDFESDLSKWTAVGISGSAYSIVADGGSDVLSIRGADSHNGFLVNSVSFDDFIFETKVRTTQDNGSTCVPEVGFRYSSTLTRYITQLRHSPTDDILIRKYYNGATQFTLETDYSYVLGNEYYDYRILANGNTVRLYLNHELVSEPTNEGTDVLSGYLCLQNYFSDYPVYYDDVRVRTFADPEPSTAWDISNEQANPDFLTVNFTTDNILCYGGNDGSVNLTVTNGTAPYDYSLTGAMELDGTSENNEFVISSLIAGSYNIQLEDTYNKTGEQSFVISQPEALSLNYTINDPVDCNTPLATVNITATGGTGTHPFNGEGEFTQGIGTTEYTVRDENGCEASISVTVSPTGSWLSPGWLYRIPVTISNTDGVLLEDYQVQVDLSASVDFDKTGDSGSDIRFTSDDGITQIPFWIEAWDETEGSEQAVFWIKVSSIPAEGEATVYLYYGNPSAGNASSGGNTFDFFDDFSGYAETVSNDAAIGKAISWMKVAQDVYTVGGSATGVANSYNYPSGPWSGPDYQEVTGYIVPTMFDQYHSTGETELRSRAIQMADWLVDVQNADGTWEVSIFNTGQVMDGLLRAYDELIGSSDEGERTKAAGYLEAATEAGEFLVSTQETDGSWNNDRCYNGFPHAYHSRIDWPLLRLWQRIGDNRYLTATIANLNWILSLEAGTSGWFNNNGLSLSTNTYPVTHTIGYCAEGLLECGLILTSNINQDIAALGQSCIAAAQRTADALLGQIDANGSLSGGAYNSDWTPHTTDECLTGSAQMSIVWTRLYHHTDVSDYLNAARAMNRYLVTVQGNSTDTGIDGGIAGSDPISGYYTPNKILPWATKFFIDALYYESLYGEDYQIPGIDPDKWIFPSGGQYFSIDNNMLLFDAAGSFSSPYPTMRAQKDGIDYTFSDGIIEYEFMSDLLSGQLGVYYRGTTPESDYCYTLNPNTTAAEWRFIRRNNATTSVLTDGGSFALSTWYDIKAVIDGSAHSFYGTGSADITGPADATFSSGTCGLMGWSTGARAWVDNFRIRKYADSEPSVTVGDEESPGQWTGDEDADWNNASNWADDVVPGPCSIVTISPSPTQPLISGTGNVCYGLMIMSGSTITVDDGGELTVGGNLENNGNLIIESAAYVEPDGLISSGSLIVKGTGTGTVTFNRFLRPESSTGDKHLFSSPVGGLSIPDFLTTYDAKVDFLRVWDEDDAVWSEVTTEYFQSGKGYNVYQATNSDGEFSFTGSVVSNATYVASSPYALDYDSRVDYDDTDPWGEFITDLDYWAPGRGWTSGWGGGGWNLLGNPFTSAMDASLFISTNLNSFDPYYQALYVYDGIAGLYKYSAESIPGYPEGADSHGSIVQAGQGFMVLANNNGAEFDFTSSMQTHSTGTVLLKSAVTDDPWPGVQLKAKYGEKEHQTLIVYNDNMSVGLDPGYDIGLLSAGSGVEIYTTLVGKDEGVNLARQALPVTGADRITVAVGVDSEQGGEVTFTAFTVPLGSNKFWLEDRTAGVFTDLTTKSYTVTLPAKSYGTGRFFIVASTNTPTGSDDAEAEDRGLRIWSAYGRIIIKGSVSDKAVCEIFDMQGTRIIERLLSDGELNTVDLPSGLRGVFYIRVIDGVRVTTAKVAVL